MLSIGEFARATHLSVKTLHHYHEVGVLVPAAVDPSTGYRRYAARQVPDAHLARRLRDVRMPLDEVRAVLVAPEGPPREALVAAHLDRLRRELAATAAAVASLQAMLVAPAASAVTVRLLPEQRVISVRDVIGRDEIGPWCEQAYPRLFAGLARLGASPAGPGGGLYGPGWFEDGGGEVTAFLPLDAAVRETAGPADGRVRVTTLPAQRVAAVLHAGSMDDLDLSYGLLGRAVDGRDDGAEGPIRELYLVSPADTADPAALRTEICWPLTPLERQES